MKIQKKILEVQEQTNQLLFRPFWRVFYYEFVLFKLGHWVNLVNGLWNALTSATLLIDASPRENETIGSAAKTVTLFTSSLLE